MRIVRIFRGCQASASLGRFVPINLRLPGDPGPADRRDRPYQRAHLPGAALLAVAERHGQHHRDDQAGTGGHLGEATDEMLFEAEVGVERQLDALQGAASVVAALPARPALGSPAP